MCSPCCNIKSDIYRIFTIQISNFHTTEMVKARRRQASRQRHWTQYSMRSFPSIWITHIWLTPSFVLPSGTMIFLEKMTSMERPLWTYPRLISMLERTQNGLCSSWRYSAVHYHHVLIYITCMCCPTWYNIDKETKYNIVLILYIHTWPYPSQTSSTPVL